MWIDFVTNLATVGKGRIKYYQLWDTPQDTTHWTGSITQLIRISQDAYNTIKAIDPNAKVLSPPSGAYKGAPNTCMIANREEPNFFMNGGGAYSDIISFNTYYDIVAEDIIPVISCLETMLANYGQNTKPLWASEGGWGTPRIWPRTLQSAFLARSYLVLLSQGVSRFYWYAWNNPNWGTLYNKNLGVLPPGKAYAQVYGWIVGRSFNNLARPIQRRLDVRAERRQRVPGAGHLGAGRVPELYATQPVHPLPQFIGSKHLHNVESADHDH